MNPPTNESASLRDLNVPYLEQYFGAWAMWEERFLATFEHVRKMNVQMHLQEVQAAAPPAGSGRRYAAQVTDSGIAVVDIAGTMMKQSSSMGTSTSTVMMRNTLRQLASSADVKGVMIRIDSPGGTVAGTADLADEVAALAAAKPVCAFVEDLAASAAYWVASQAGEISAGRGALVGSIGTYGVVYDSSAAAAMEGIKTHVIRAGAFKGAGAPGTEVSTAQLAELQRTVNSLNEDFLSAVGSGRKMSAEEVAKINDGRIHKAPDAKAMGLIDHVESFDAAMARMESRVASAGKSKINSPGGRSAAASLSSTAQSGPDMESTMDKQSPTPNGSTAVAESSRSANLAELKAACPGAPSDFIVAEMEKGSTAQAAATSFINFQQAQIRARDEELEKAKAKAASSGVRPLATGASATVAGGGDAITQFDAMVNAKKAAGLPYSRAVAAVVADNPELHREYVKAKNGGKDRILADYYGSADSARNGRI